jgi:hypothetical protein
MRIALLAAVIALVPAASFAQNPAGVDVAAVARDSAVAAKQSLSTLAALSHGENATRLGFRTAEEAAQSDLGAPLSDFIVGLDDLRAWQPGKDPMSLLHPTGLVVYPVTVGGAVRSSLTLVKQGNEWKAVSFGAPAQTQAVAGTRDGVARAGVAAASTFQVRIPAFNLVFIGYLTGGRLALAPALDVARYELTRGIPVAADTLFTRLKPFAEQDQGLPR